MDFRQIRYFVCLVEEGSVTRAASRLNVVQPALSMQISKLEQQVGQKLFERTPSGMVPTESAKAMYRLLLPVLSNLQQAQTAIEKLSGGLSGRVTVGIVASVTYGLLAKGLYRFDNECPHVSLIVEEGYSPGLIERVRSGSLDLALVNLPKERAGLSVDPLLPEEFLLVSGLSQPAAIPSKVKLAALSTLKLVLPSKRHGLRAAIDRGAAAKGIKLSPKFEIDALPAIIDLVEHGDFVSLLPPVAIRRHLSEGRVRSHTVMTPRTRTTLGWIYHARRPLSPAASKFIEIFGRMSFNGLE